MTRWILAMTTTLAAVGVASAAVQTKTVEYEYDGTKLKGFLAYDDAVTGKMPGVLVFPEWMGLGEHAKNQAKKLAALGYVAFAGDLYGDGLVVTTVEEAMKNAGTLRKDPKMWRGRAAAALKTLAAQPNVDPTKLAAIGYCLGGTTCFQLAYSGADLKAVVGFHAGLMNPTPDEAKAIKARILVANGADDKFITEKQIAEFKSALDDAKVKYHYENIPGVVHSFTNPDADKMNNPNAKYNKEADEKSWQMMRELFKETLGK